MPRQSRRNRDARDSQSREFLRSAPLLATHPAASDKRPALLAVNAQEPTVEPLVDLTHLGTQASPLKFSAGASRR